MKRQITIAAALSTRCCRRTDTLEQQTSVIAPTRQVVSRTDPRLRARAAVSGRQGVARRRESKRGRRRHAGTTIDQVWSLQTQQ